MSIALATVMLLAASVSGSSVSVYLTGPSSYVSPKQEFNISIRFSTAVEKFTPYMVQAINACPKSNRWTSISRGGSRFVGVWYPGIRCPRLSGGPSFSRDLQSSTNPTISIYIPTDTLPAGNERSNALIIPFRGPGSEVNSTIVAPSFHAPSDASGFLATIRFTSSISPWSTSSLQVTGATVASSWAYTNCLFFKTPSADAGQVEPATSPAQVDRYNLGGEEGQREGNGRSLQINIGSCSVFVASIVPSGTGPITITVPPNVVTGVETSGSTANVPYDNVNPKSKYNVSISTRNGRNSFGDRDVAVYVRFTFDGDAGSLVTGFTPDKVQVIPTGAAVASSSWSISPRPLPSTSRGRALQFGPDPNTNQYELAIYPVANRWFGVLVPENAVDAPGNAATFQNFSYSGSNGGDDRPPSVRITGTTSFNNTASPLTVTFFWTGQAADIATFSSQMIRTAYCSVVQGSLRQLDSYNFQAQILPAASVPTSDTRRINVWVPADSVVDNTASFNFTSYFRSTLTPVRTVIEAPSFFNWGYCTTIYITTDQPVDVTAFTPQDLRVSGGLLCSTSWQGAGPDRPPVGQVQDFSIAVRPTGSSWGGYSTISVYVPYNSINVPQGNYGSNTRRISYSAYTGIRPPACSLVSAAPSHAGPDDEFLVEVTCASPLSGSTISSAYQTFAVVGGRTYSYLSGTTFPASNFFVRVRPYGNSDVTIILPSNVADSPGNQRAYVTVPYDPDSPGSPVLVELRSASETHEGDVVPELLITVSFARPSSALAGKPVTSIVQVTGGTIVNNAWNTAPTNSSGYASFLVQTKVGDNVTVAVPANVVAGLRNTAASLTVPYKAPGVLTTLTAPTTTHDGRCPIAYSVTFGEAVTGFTPAGVYVNAQTAASVVPVLTGKGAGPYTGTVAPNGYSYTIQIQVNQDVVASPPQGNYESASRSVSYARPSWRQAITPTITAPDSHDGRSVFIVNITWPQSVYAFTPAGLSLVGGAAYSDWEPADLGNCLTYSVRVKPLISDAIAFTVPSKALPAPGANAVTATIPFRSGPTPSPAASPSPFPTPTPLPNNRCSWFNGIECNFGVCVSDDGGYCRCNEGYAGYNCIIQIRNSTKTCFDNRKDGDESDVDCGGSCGPCASGRTCAKPSDCSGGDSFCTKEGICTPRLINAAKGTGGKVATMQLSFVGFAEGGFTAAVEESLRQTLVGFIPAGTASGHSYTTVDVLITRVRSLSEAQRSGAVDAEAVARMHEGLARSLATRDGVLVSERLERARRLAADANSTTVVDMQVNLASVGDGDDVVYWANYAIGGNRLLFGIVDDLPGLHLASIEPTQYATVADAPSANLQPISGGGDNGGGNNPTDGVGIPAAAGIAVGALVLGGILGAGILFACRRRDSSPPLNPPRSGEDMEMGSVTTPTGPKSRVVINPLEGAAIN